MKEFKTLTGNYEVIAHKLGYGVLCMPSNERDAKDTIAKDFPRTSFLGNENEYRILQFKWSMPVTPYAQGNIDCGLPTLLLPARQYARHENNPESLKFLSIRFAYINANKQACGIGLTVDLHEPRRWVLGIMSNNNAAPKERQVTLYVGPNYDIEYTKNITWKTMMSDLVRVIKSSAISPIIRAVLKADGTLNMPLFNKIYATFENHRLVNPADLINHYDDLDTTLTTLNAQCIIGCDRYIESWISKMPHNTSERQNIIDLCEHLKRDSKSTAITLQNFLNASDDISYSVSSVSCLLIAIIESDLLRGALDLIEFTVEDLKNSKEVREDCRVRILNMIAEKLNPAEESDSDEVRPISYDY